MEKPNFKDIFPLKQKSKYNYILNDPFSINIYHRYNKFNSIILNYHYKNYHNFYDENKKYHPIFILHLLSYVIKLKELLETDIEELYISIEIENLKKDYLKINKKKNDIFFKICFEINYNLTNYEKYQYINFINSSYLKDRLDFLP